MTASAASQPGAAPARLLLAPAALGELDEIASLHADERVWRHRPSGRHTSIEQTRGKVIEMERQWARDGLGYWTARLAQPVAGLAVGTFVGIGGCAVAAGTSWWNLYYRLRPELHGHGLATELSRSAVTAAGTVNPDRPIVAYLLEDNQPSKAVAERAGLQLQWRGPDPANPQAVRLIYADRPIGSDRLTAINTRS